MFPFLIKKTFFDMWDNLFRIFALNLGYVLLISGTGFLLTIVPSTQLAYFSVLVVGSAALSVFTMGTSAIVSELADYKTPEWKMFVEAIRARWLPAILLVLLNAAIFLFLLMIALPVYVQSTIGLAALGFLGWAAVFWLLSLQSFFPLITKIGDPFRKTLRKCFTLLFDNTGFTLGLFITLNISAPYVLGLFLLSTRLSALVWQVTAFTVAHAVTLSLAATDVVSVPGDVVEPLDQRLRPRVHVGQCR